MCKYVHLVMETSNAKIHLFAFVSASTVFHFELVVSFGVICSLILVKRQFRYLEVDCEKLFHASFFGNVWLPLGEAACYKNAVPWRLCIVLKLNSVASKNRWFLAFALYIISLDLDAMDVLVNVL